MLQENTKYLRKQYQIVLVQSQKKTKIQNLESIKKDFNLNQISIKFGSSFWSIEDDFSTIYDNFNLLSYFSDSCGVRVLKRSYSIQSTDAQKPQVYQHFKILSLRSNAKDESGQNHQNEYLIVQEQKDQLNLSQLPQLSKPLQIKHKIYKYYQQYKNKKLQQLNLQLKDSECSIIVSFQTQIIDYQQENGLTLLHVKNRQIVSNNKRQLIKINIIDSKGWIGEKFKNRPIRAHHHRISNIKKSTIYQTQYFYKQAQDERKKQFPYQSVSLALQGGGCKGVVYIGAYKAIKQMIQKRSGKINSIIGSSAGGILGLAICCGMTTQQIVQLCEQKLSKITNDQAFKTVIQDKSRIMEKTFDNFFKFLVKFNIFDEKILNILKEVLLDLQVQGLFLQLIRNKTNQQIERLFLDQITKRLNLVGLLKASLMSGKTISQIAQQCLFTLFKKVSKWDQARKPQFYKKQCKNQTIAQFYAFAEKITLKQLYQLTQIQFTCTAVDLNSHILRFFNQKTTPNLPVCKAVQMTGSFPVAFQAQSWKKQWGKYYIHYEDIRKQIDITGHKFTDGGTLANFPIKYLDNQYMRPMYFSHAKSSNTLMYGVGLVSDIKADQSKLRQAQKIFGKLSEIANKKISKWQALTSYLKPNVNTKSIQINSTTFQQITSIPLVQFILNLLQTYSKTKDNLIQQCFQHSSFQTHLGNNYKQQLMQRPNEQQIIEKLNKLYKTLQKILAIESFQNNHQQLQKLFIANLTYIQNISKFDISNQNVFYNTAKTVSSMIQSFFSLLFEDLTQQQIQINLNRLANIIQQQFKVRIETNSVNYLLNTCGQFKAESVLMLGDLHKDFQVIRQICRVLRKFVIQMKQQKSSNILIERALLKSWAIQLKNQKDMLNDIKMHSENKEFNTNNKIIYFYEKTISSRLLTPLKTIHDLGNAIKQCQIPQLFIQYQSLLNKNVLKSYTLKQISNYYSYPKNKSQKLLENTKNQEPDGIHIVLQAQALSEIYFQYYFQTIKQTLSQYNHNSRRAQQMNNRKMNMNMIQNSISEQTLYQLIQYKQKPKQIKVTTLTATGYQSIAIFLHASDLPQSRIQELSWTIRKQLIKIDTKKIEEKFNGVDWTKSMPLLLRQAQQLAIQNKKSVFSFLEQTIQKNRNQYTSQFIKLKEKVNYQSQNFIITDEQMTNAVQNSLNYVVSCLIDFQKLEKDNLNAFLSQITLNVKPEKYFQKFNNNSANLRAVAKFFFDKYKQIIQYLVSSSFFVVDNIVKMLQPSDRMFAWKGLILSELISGDRIKNFAINVLEQLKLKRDTTLKQFYEYSSKKIQLNFFVVEEQMVRIYNYKTAPNMPIWAALLSASSTPDFFSPVISNPSWKSRVQQNYRLRVAKKYFQGQNKPFKQISSSQALTKLPIDLLKNNIFKSKITDLQNQIFLIINFSPVKIQNIMKMKQIKVTNLALGQLVKNFVSFFGTIVESISPFSVQTTEKKNVNSLKMLSNIPALKSKKKMLNLYINSHDNLILQLYKSQLILVPVRLDTLDFNLMIQRDDRENEHQDKLSTKCWDAIMQAEYVVKQKIQNQYSYWQKQKLINSFTQAGNTDPNIQLTKLQIAKQYFNAYPSYQYKRIIYFRIQSIDLIQFMDKLEMNKYINTNIQNISTLPNKIKSQNMIKIRFLSILNPCKQIYEQYYIYIRKSADKRASYMKILTQALYLNQLEHEQIDIKIQFSSAQKFTKKTHYFRLDLRNIFLTNLLTNIKKLNAQPSQYAMKSFRFGFVYCLQYSSLHCKFNNKYQLKPINPKQDYMNRQNNDIIPNPPLIGIQSLISQTQYSLFACQKCLMPFYLQKYKQKSKQDEGSIMINSNSPVGQFENNRQTSLVCLNCHYKCPLIQKYYIEFNSQLNRLQCWLGHQIVRNQSNNVIGMEAETKKDMVLQRCDLCGKCSFEKHCFNSSACYNDYQCQIIICDICRTQLMSVNKTSANDWID